MGTVVLRATTAPDATYQNLGATLSHAQLDSNMTLFLRNDVADNMAGNLGVTGTITATGNITAFGSVSDITLKENILAIDSPLDKLSKLNGYYFNYIGDKERLIGVIAQEVEKVLPELVYEFTPVGKEEVKKAVRYELFTALLLEAIKELNSKVQFLEKTLQDLQTK